MNSCLVSTLGLLQQKVLSKFLSCSVRKNFSPFCLSLGILISDDFFIFVKEEKSVHSTLDIIVF